MRVRIIGAVFAAVVVAGFSGCSPISEPWDNAGYFKEERASSEELQKQLRHRLLHAQIDAARPAHHTQGS
jgi:hypothetical protein